MPSFLQDLHAFGLAGGPLPPASGRGHLGNGPGCRSSSTKEQRSIRGPVWYQTPSLRIIGTKSRPPISYGFLRIGRVCGRRAHHRPPACAFLRCSGRSSQVGRVCAGVSWRTPVGAREALPPSGSHQPRERRCPPHFGAVRCVQQRLYRHDAAGHARTTARAISSQEFESGGG